MDKIEHNLPIFRLNWKKTPLKLLSVPIAESQTLLLKLLLEQLWHQLIARAHPFDWEITAETDSINGFLSQKAMCNFGGRRWEAWFTPDIPYSDGPYKFCGLPGLILKIVDTKGHYKFEVLKLELPEQNTMVEFYDYDYIKTTKKEFNKMMDDYYRDLPSILKGMGIDASSAQQASQSVSSQNNPLELERK